MVGAGVLTSTIYWAIAREIAPELVQMHRFFVYFACFGCSFAFCASVLAIWNKTVTGAAFPKPTMRNIYANKRLFQAAVMGVFMWGLPVGLPLTVAQKVWQQPSSDNLVLGILMPLLIWTGCGALFGVSMRGVERVERRSA